MIVGELEIPGVIEIVVNRFDDERGFFSETWNAAHFEQHGLNLPWVQDNHTCSLLPFVLRGLHFQTPPFAQDKLVRVVQGAIFDVALDIRQGSPTFGKWVGLEISREKWNEVFIPKGFAHGFLTLMPNTEVIYKVSAPFSPLHDRSIRYDDPGINIDWPLGGRIPVLSTKDARAPKLRELDTGFLFESEDCQGRS